MMRIRISVLVLAVLATAAAAAAQDIALPDSRDVFVRSTDGIEIRGRLLDLQPLTLSMFVEGTRRDMPSESIDRIQTRGGDGVMNGALIGAAIGAAVWTRTIAREGAESVPFAIGTALGYGLIGAGIDAMIPGRTTIYAKPRQGSSTAPDTRAGSSVGFGF